LVKRNLAFSMEPEVNGKNPSTSLPSMYSLALTCWPRCSPVSWGQCYDYNFHFFLNNQLYDPIKKTNSMLNKKTAFFSRKFSAKMF
jgi:hypothetical protein